MLLYGDLTEKIIGAAIEVHRVLGPGLLESTYEECLCYELSKLSISFTRQTEIPVLYKTIRLDCGYRADIIVEDKVIMEIKSVDGMHPIFEAQLLTYLKISQKRVGLLMNFNSAVLKDNIIRRVI